MYNVLEVCLAVQSGLGGQIKSHFRFRKKTLGIDCLAD